MKLKWNFKRLILPFKTQERLILLLSKGTFKNLEKLQSMMHTVQYRKLVCPCIILLGIYKSLTDTTKKIKHKIILFDQT